MSEQQKLWLVIKKHFFHAIPNIDHEQLCHTVVFFSPLSFILYWMTIAREEEFPLSLKVLLAGLRIKLT